MVHLADDLIVEELAKRWRGDSDRINEICAYALQPPIKSLCPSLLLASASAVGGNPETLVPAALATKYLYVGLVVHDDILDGDEQRWGRASVPARYGTGDALLAGDALMFSIFSTLTECGAPAESVVGAVRALADAAIELCRGAAVEDDIRGDLQCGLERYTKVASLKTAAMFRGVCQAGAILGGGDQESISRVTGYADRLGLAFQMYDDLLPYTGGSEALGNSAESDIANRRPTFPLLIGYRLADTVGREQLEFVVSGRLPVGEAYQVAREVLRSTGALDVARAQVDTLVTEAKACVEGMPGTLAAIADSCTGLTA